MNTDPKSPTSQMLRDLQTVKLHAKDASDIGNCTADVGINESDLPAHCASDPEFMRGFRVGVAERYVQEIVNATTNLSSRWNVDELVGAIEDLDVRILEALANALHAAEPAAHGSANSSDRDARNA